MGAELENASDRISQLAIQGPLATAALQKLTDINLSEIKFYTFVTGKMAGVEDVIISATKADQNTPIAYKVPFPSFAQILHV